MSFPSESVAPKEDFFLPESWIETEAWRTACISHTKLPVPVNKAGRADRGDLLIEPLWQNGAADSAK